MVRTNAYFLITALIRTYALWLGAQVLIGIPVMFMQAKNWGDGGLGVFLGIDVAVLLVAALLWLFADVIAKLGIARPQQELFESDMSRQDWQGIFFSTIGLWLLVEGALQMCHEAAQWVYVHRIAEQENFAPVVEGQFAKNVSTGLETAIGISLLLGGRGLAGLLQRMRGGGSMRREEGPADE